MTTQYAELTHEYLPDGKVNTSPTFEVVMLADQYGNLVGPANPSGMAVDAFGRARVSNPYTLYDSFHRYKDNGKENQANSAGTTCSFQANTASIDMVVGTTSGHYVYRESKKVFAYQPGKSLQILKTFVMNPHKTNLRQRVGYFDANNGFFLERSDLTANNVCFVKRSSVTGSVIDTPVNQASWNMDTLDGTGPSKLTLNLDNPQILFIDIEWLGVGSVRMGFVIDGEFIHCHTFHHANRNTSPKGAYIQSACLPVRSEIENIGITASSSTYKQICTTVISEGGYALTGRSRSYSMPPSTSRVLTTAGTIYPLVSIRLDANNIGAIVVPSSVGILPIDQGNYRYELVLGATINGANWMSAGSDSYVQYDANVSSTMSGGTSLISGYVTSTVQAGVSVINIGENLFKYQLERNSFTSTPTNLTLAIVSDKLRANVCGSISWDEIT